MRLSAILVSVNLVATVPLAARAADNAVSDKADWLKKNLASIEKTNRLKKAGKARRKVSLPDQVAVARARSVKLRPFVPNRRLPSQKDVQMELKARQDRLQRQIALKKQEAVLDRNKWRLNGEVSAYSEVSPGTYGSAATENRRPASKPASQRTLPGRSAVMPGQIATSTRTPSPIPEPQAVSTAAKPRQQLSQIPEVFTARIPGPSAIVPAPVLSADEKAYMDSLIELYKMELNPVPDPGITSLNQNQARFSSVPEASSFSRPQAGPAPFPLCMIPPDALERFLKNSHMRHYSGSRSALGNWHNQPGAARTYGGQQQFTSHARLSLPSAGFRSFVSHSGSRSKGGTFHSYAPQAQKIKSVRKTSKKAGKTSQNARRAEPYVAMYPPYKNYGSGSL